MLIYLHGFRSSPQSVKARMLAEHMRKIGRADEWHCPALPASPAAAIDMIESLIEPYAPDRLCLVGSSLGGFYATWLAEKHGCRAVLLNPALTPERDLHQYLGEQSVYWSNERIVVKPEYLGELEALQVKAISRPERYFLIAAKGDELIDWRDMVARYPGALQYVLEGSDHGLSGFEKLIEKVISFADDGKAEIS